MLSDDEAASYCGFKTVAAFRRQVRVKPVDYGNFVRYDRVRLDEWLDTLTATDPMSSIVEAAGGGDRGARRRA